MPKIIDHERYRTDLIAGCRELFARRGYRALSMREIAAALGVSTGTLYHYFPDKRSLFVHCVEATTRDDALQIVARLDRDASPRERLRALLDFIAANERGFLHQIVVTLDYYQEQALGPPTDEPIRIGIQRDRQAIARLLDHADEAVITLVLSQIIGLLVLRLFEGETRSWDAQTELLQQVIAPLLEKQAAAGS
jgi:AcrR family transcriptional regulator